MDSTHKGAALDTLAGIPNRPDVVAVVPFYWKPNETPNEQTKVIIPAGLGGMNGKFVVRGNFILDTGDPVVGLNRTFLQPSPTGGVDSITDANRIPEPQHAQLTWVKFQLGTLVDSFSTPDSFPRQQMRKRLEFPDNQPANALIDHNFGNYSWAFAPRLGNLGLPALEQFETIIDYVHRRVVFVRLDTAGRRLVDVPAYRPAHVVPLMRMTSVGGQPGIVARIGAKLDTLMLDTGTGSYDEAEQRAAIQLQKALAAGHTVFDVDSTALNDITSVGLPNGSTLVLLGYSFLRQLGVVGFNFRAKQLLLYQPAAAP